MMEHIRTGYNYDGTMSGPFGSPSQKTVDSVAMVKTFLDNFLTELKRLHEQYVLEE